MVFRVLCLVGFITAYRYYNRKEDTAMEIKEILYDSDYIIARINNGKDDEVLVINDDGDICFRLG